MSAPPFAYFGGKQRIAKRIIGHLPPHEHYVEPFAGSLSVLLAKPQSRMETVNDLDGDLMTFWRVLRDEPAELAYLCSATPHSRADFTLAKDRPEGLTDLERARRVWVVLTQGRSPSLRDTGWRFNIDSVTAAMPSYVAAYRRRLLTAAERLVHVTLESRPAFDVIAQYGASPNVCLYVDPPYLDTTRVVGGYGHEMGTEAEHRALGEALRACRAAVLLSGYASPVYDDLFDDCDSLTIDAHTGQGNTDWGRTEVLWSNRPLNVEAGLFEIGDAS